MGFGELAHHGEHLFVAHLRRRFVVAEPVAGRDRLRALAQMAVGAGGGHHSETQIPPLLGVGVLIAQRLELLGGEIPEFGGGETQAAGGGGEAPSLQPVFFYWTVAGFAGSGIASFARIAS